MVTTIVFLVSAYLILTCYLGFRAYRGSINTAEDYFVAGRTVTWFHLGLTFFATWFSTLAFLGVSGFNFKRGVSWYYAQGTFWMLAPLAAWLLGRKLWERGRECGYITPGDLLADSYDSNLIKLLVGIMGMMALIPYILVQLVGIGKVLEASTNGVISYPVAVIVTAVATAFYTVIGGIRAIIWTDVIQGILFLGVTLLTVFIAVDAAGGLAIGLATAQQVRPEAFTFDVSNIGVPLTTIIIWTPGLVLLPHLWQRNYMAKSKESFAKGLVVLSAMSFVMLIATMLIGATAISFISDLQDSDKLVPVIFRDYAPTFLPLMVLATFAAGMSTIDSQLLSASSVIIRDVFGLQKIEPKKEKLLGRVVVICLIILLANLALLPESQGAIFTLASKGTAVAFLLLVPLLGALNQAPKQVGLVTLISGLSVFLLLELKVISWSLPFGFGSPVAAFLVQALLCIYFSYRKLAKQ